MDMYQKVANKYKDSPAVVFLFIASFVMLAIGCWLFWEDTVSSKIGLQNIQSAFNMNVQTYPFTYWVMSLAPQVASIVFFYIFMADTDKKGALAASLGFQAMDFFADAWYRSNDQLFDSPAVFAMSGFLTLVYFSIGSEVFVTVGFGLVLKLWPTAVRTFRNNVKGITQTYKDAKNENHNSNKSNSDFKASYREVTGNKSEFRPAPKPGKPQSGASLFSTILDEEDLKALDEEVRKEEAKLATSRKSHRPGQF